MSKRRKLNNINFLLQVFLLKELCFNESCKGPLMRFCLAVIYDSLAWIQLTIRAVSEKAKLRFLLGLENSLFYVE